MPMKRIPTRYVLVLGTFLLSMLLYVDRVCISAAKESVAADLRLSDKQMGWILSVFALGYALFQTPSGMLADRYGPRKILAAVVTFWSIFTGLTGLAWNYTSMIVFRLLFGIGEAGAYPGCARAIYSWIPMAERGTIQGVNFSGGRFGAAFALPVVAAMVTAFGWRSSFAILAAVGFIWAAFWHAWFRDDPVLHPRIPDDERDLILATRQQSAAGIADAPRLTAGLLFGSRNMWLTMGQYFCSNFTFFFCLTWLFPHLRSKYSLGAVEAGFYASATMVFAAVGNWVAGATIDAIYRRGRWSLSRRLPAMVGFLLGAVGLLVSVHMNTALGAIFWLSVATFGCDMTISPSWSFCIDIGGSHAGAVSGTMNMAGNLGSFVTGLAFPYLLAWTGTETTFFYVGAVLNLLAIILWSAMRADRPLVVSRRNSPVVMVDEAASSAR
jgi:ACS family glucarate transporter-like MFS transporter